jgi:shikimate 5-dehydrogenase
MALRARGVRAANGLGLLIEQALLAQEFWHGSMPPRTALEEAVGCTDPFAPWSGPPGGSPGD